MVLKSLESGVEKAFLLYVGNKSHMKKQLYVKMLLEYHIIDDNLTEEMVDKIFESTATDPRGLTLSQFKETIPLLAKQKQTIEKALLVIISNISHKKTKSY